MNIYQFIQKKFPEDKILATFKVVWRGTIITEEEKRRSWINKLLIRTSTGTVLGSGEFFTLLPGCRLIITDKHYFFCLGKIFKGVVWGLIFCGLITLFLFIGFNLGFKIALIICIFLSFTLFTLFYFWIRRMERNYWPRGNLRFVDRNKKIIGIFAPNSERLGYAGPYSEELFVLYGLLTLKRKRLGIPGIVRFKIKENFEKFEALIKEDFKKYNIGEQDITRFSDISLLLLIIFTFFFFLIFFYVLIITNFFKN